MVAVGVTHVLKAAGAPGAGVGVMVAVGVTPEHCAGQLSKQLGPTPTATDWLLIWELLAATQTHPATRGR